MDLSNIITTDCEIIRMGDEWIYPIFKNGWNGFRRAKEESKFNKEIKDVDMNNIYLRHPVERFISGVNKYAQLHKLEPEDVVDKIEREGLTNRHWMPQWYWLLHLSKYYKGDVKLLPMSAIPHNRKDKSPYGKKLVRVLEEHIGVDLYIMNNYLNTTAKLETVVKDSRKCIAPE